MPAIRGWLGQKGALAGRTLDIRDVALPYNYGREGDVYHFSYAWLYPASGS